MSKLSKNTERAISLITVEKNDPFLYWPSYLRNGNRIRPDGVVTSNPPTEKEQLERIVEADPLGFLLALMNGLPVPVLHVNEDYDPDLSAADGNMPYTVKPETANLSVRRDIAQHLLTKLIANKQARNRPERTKPKQSIFEKVMEHVADERAAPAEKDGTV